MMAKIRKQYIWAGINVHLLPQILVSICLSEKESQSIGNRPAGSVRKVSLTSFCTAHLHQTRKREVSVTFKLSSNSLQKTHFNNFLFSVSEKLLFYFLVMQNFVLFLNFYLFLKNAISLCVSGKYFVFWRNGPIFWK